MKMIKKVMASIIFAVLVAYIFICSACAVFCMEAPGEPAYKEWRVESNE